MAKQFKSLVGAHPHRAETLVFHRSAVEKVIRMMRTDPGAPLDWKFLSEIACISRHHFLRVFEEQTGLSPHQFLIFLRMEMAKILLVETLLPVNAVGCKAGYASSATFVRTFGNLVGIAPGRFRHQAQQMNAAKVEQLLTTEWNQSDQNSIIRKLHVCLRVPESFSGT